MDHNRKDYFMYEKCLQYDVNFTQIFSDNGNKWPKKGDDSWNVTSCREGWTYDKSEYENTLVTEVGKETHSVTV